MKPGKRTMQAMLLLLLLGALAYFGVYAYHVFLDSADTAVVYDYIGESVCPAEGFVIREEHVLTGGGTLVENAVAEGENVANGDPVAWIYDSKEALDQHRQLVKLEEELKRLNYIYSRGTEESDAMKLNSEIVSAITTLRGNTAQGNYNDLSRNVTNLKDLVFRRDFTYSTSSALAGQLQEVNNQVLSLRSANQKASSTIYSDQAGIFSAMVDGYEETLLPENLEELTPEKLREMTGKKNRVSANTLGKVIGSFQWYYAAIMDESATTYIQSGQIVTVNFEGAAGAQRMEVQSISEPDADGKIAVVFTSDRNLSETTMLREQNVDVVYGSFEGLRIPAGALRADTETGQLGVYRQSGAQADWVPVELVYSGTDYYLVRSIGAESMSELQEAKQLRTGDRVLVRGKNMHNGKVVS